MSAAAGDKGGKRPSSSGPPGNANRVLFVLAIGQALLLVHLTMPTLIALSSDVLGLCAAVFNFSLKGTGRRHLTFLAAANFTLAAVHLVLASHRGPAAGLLSQADPPRLSSRTGPAGLPGDSAYDFSLLTFPAHAEVVIDDRPSPGEATLRLSPGRHTVLVTSPGYRDHAATIEIPAQRAATFVLRHHTAE